jgi:hypothetical protein
MTNTWQTGISKATGTYCGISFSGTIVDSMVARNTACDVKVVLDSPIDVYGITRTYIWTDSESVRIGGAA